LIVGTDPLELSPVADDEVGPPVSALVVDDVLLDEEVDDVVLDEEVDDVVVGEEEVVLPGEEEGGATVVVFATRNIPCRASGDADEEDRSPSDDGANLPSTGLYCESGTAAGDTLT
jgi:hypothetical protein